MLAAVQRKLTKSVDPVIARVTDDKYHASRDHAYHFFEARAISSATVSVSCQVNISRRVITAGPPTCADRRITEAASRADQR